MLKTAIVDIDNTLWQFCDPFYEELKRINKDFPAPENWTQWNIWEGYCTEEEFLGAVSAVHRMQDNDNFKPYPEARGFLQKLESDGYRITIASHRSPEFMTVTEKWLRKHGLVYHDIHLSFEKTKLISGETTTVVDDSPSVLEKAVEHGVFAAGLLFPWNRAFRNNGFTLCRDLNEILERVLNEAGRIR